MMIITFLDDLPVK